MNNDNAGKSRHTWDAEKDFLKQYRSLIEMMETDGYSTAYDMLKKLRTKVYNNTVDIVSQGCYGTEDGTECIFPSDVEMIYGTVFYDQEINITQTPPNDEYTMVEVKGTNCLDAAVELIGQGFKPAVLNMGSKRTPGGGVALGINAQEEMLFRRTNLFRSLYQFTPDAEQYGITQSHHQYPLDRDHGGVYTPHTILFRESETKGYALMNSPTPLSIISVADINCLDLTDEDQKTIKNKIRTIFRIGLSHGHDSLVLGPLGCSDYNNFNGRDFYLPIKFQDYIEFTVARLFRQVMEEPEFINRFKCLVFAIETYDDIQGNNPEDSCKNIANGLTRFDLESDFNRWIERNGILSIAQDCVQRLIQRGCPPHGRARPHWESAKIRKTRHKNLKEVITKHGDYLASVDQDIDLFDEEGELVATFHMWFNDMGRCLDDWYTYPDDAPIEYVE